MKYPLPTIRFSIKNLELTWKHSKDSTGRGGAPGADKVKAPQFKESLYQNLRLIREEIKAGEFKFRKLKACPIKKDNGKCRMICIPTVRDRLVQRLMLYQLVKGKDLFGAKNGISFGVTKGEGTHAAIDTAIKLRNKHPWVLKTDISAFFDMLPREILKKLVKAKLGRNSLVPLLMEVIDTEIDDREYYIKNKIAKETKIEKGRGLRQGMPLSPILANLVLTKFDKKLIKAGLKVVRYVDDIIVFADSEEECLKAKDIIDRGLDKLGLMVPGFEVKESKTVLIEPGKEVEFLGLEIYLGSNGKYAKKIPEYAKKDILESISNIGSFKYCIMHKKDNLTAALSWIRNLYRGYKAAYSGASDLNIFLVEVDKVAYEAKIALLGDIFSQDIVNKLSKEKLAFIGLR